LGGRKASALKNPCNSFPKVLYRNRGRKKIEGNPISEIQSKNDRQNGASDGGVDDDDDNDGVWWQSGVKVRR